MYSLGRTGYLYELLSSWKIKVKYKLYMESPHNRETRNLRLLLRKTVGTYRSRAQRAHINHKLELEGQVYHFSWSKWCSKEPERLNMELWGLVFTQEGFSLVFIHFPYYDPIPFLFGTEMVTLLVCNFTPSPTIVYAYTVEQCWNS